MMQHTSMQYNGRTIRWCGGEDNGRIMALSIQPGRKRGGTGEAVACGILCGSKFHLQLLPHGNQLAVTVFIAETILSTVICPPLSVRQIRPPRSKVDR